MTIENIINEIIRNLINIKDKKAEVLQNYVVETIDTIHTQEKYNTLTKYDIDFINDKRIEIASIYELIELLENYKKNKK